MSRAVTDATDCGWLCDVTNLFTNAFNEGRDAAAELDRWPWERVVQMHFAGGRISEGVLIDSHDAPTSPEVWRLLEAAVARADVKGVILERDERLPPFAELLDELDQGAHDRAAARPMALERGPGGARPAVHRRGGARGFSSRPAKRRARARPR